MLRVLSAAAILLAAASAFAQAPFMQTDVERAGGTYLSLPAANAQVCATHCARDGLCLAWTYTAHSCALKAVVTPALAKQGAVSGLAPRAPQFAALVGHQEPLSPIPAPLVGASGLAPPQAAMTLAPSPAAFGANLAAPEGLRRLVPAPPEKIATATAAGPNTLGYTWTAAAASPALNGKAPTSAAPAIPPAPTQIAWLTPRLPLDVSPNAATTTQHISVSPDKIEPDEELLGGPDDAF